MDIDKNIENYSYEELTTILGLVYPASDKDINEKADMYIDKYQKKNDEEMVTFFQDIKIALLEENDDIQIKKEENSTNIFNVPVKKDVLNPLLTNVTTRVVNIDSQYRDNTFENNIQQTSSGIFENSNNEFSSTYFNANLCDHLYNVLSITLDNIIIPKSWYAIDVAYNNNFFWITNKGRDYIIILESGNYSGPEFVDLVTNAMIQTGFTSDKGFCSYNSSTNKFSFHLDGCLDPQKNSLVTVSREILTEDEMVQALELYAYFTFYDVGNVKLYHYISNYGTNDFQDLNLCSLPSMTIDSTLGWLMGFRLPYVFVQTTGNNAPIPINLNGTSYFLLALMDYQTNRINNDIVTIVNKNNSQIMLPNYINASLLYKCINTKNNVPNIINEDSVDRILFNQTSVNTKIKQFIPSAPRILTQSQLYTTNEILKNNLKKTVDYRSSGPTTNDVLALIPVNTQGVKDGNVYIQDKIRTNKRVFFGPVNIDRFTVRLINDRGQLVNLNGSDWSFTLNVEILYQI
jgi:hypothetical protein